MLRIARIQMLDNTQKDHYQIQILSRDEFFPFCLDSSILAGEYQCNGGLNELTPVKKQHSRQATRRATQLGAHQATRGAPGYSGRTRLLGAHQATRGVRNGRPRALSNRDREPRPTRRAAPQRHRNAAQRSTQQRSFPAAQLPGSAAPSSAASWQRNFPAAQLPGSAAPSSAASWQRSAQQRSFLAAQLPGSAAPSSAALRQLSRFHQNAFSLEACTPLEAAPPTITATQTRTLHRHTHNAHIRARRQPRHKPVRLQTAGSSRS
jgi:hypothetical protein